MRCPVAFALAFALGFVLAACRKGPAPAPSASAALSASPSAEELPASLLDAIVGRWTFPSPASEAAARVHDERIRRAASDEERAMLRAARDLVVERAAYQVVIERRRLTIREGDRIVQQSIFRVAREEGRAVTLLLDVDGGEAWTFVVEGEATIRSPEIGRRFGTSQLARVGEQ